MRLIQLFFAVIIVSLFLAACTGSHGKEYKLDNFHNVYYKGEGTTEADAAKLAGFLKNISYFQDSLPSSVQFEKNGDTININFVVDELKLKDVPLNSYLIIGAFISDSVFNKTPVTVQLTDGELKPLKNLGYARPVSEFNK